MAQLNDLIVTGNSRFINKTYTSTADINCITASSAAGATEHGAGTTGQALVSDGDSVYWGDPQHANTADEAQHATSATTLDDTEFIEDNEPYLFREAPREAGNRVYEDAIVGGSVAWNQIVQNGDFSDGITNWSVGSSAVTISASNNVLTIQKTGTSSNGTTQKGDALANHVYLCTCEAKKVSGNSFQIRYMGLTSYTIIDSESWMRANQIVKPSESGADINIVYVRYPGENVGTANVRNVNIYDLTQMFANDPAIADYAYSLEQAEAGSGIAWLKSQGFFNKIYYPNNTGSIKSVKTNAKKVVGFNQWDEQWESGSIDVNGANESNNNRIRSKNYIPVLSDAVYYIKKPIQNTRIFYYDSDKNFISYESTFSVNKTFTTPSNCKYMRFWNESTPYANDICINLSDSERDGEYEPYEEHIYPLGNDELRGLFKLNTTTNKIYADGDIKTSDGHIARKYGIIDLGEKTWNLRTEYTYPVFQTSITDIDMTSILGAHILLCSKYPDVGTKTLGGSDGYGNNNFDKTICKLYGDYSGVLVQDSSYSDAETFKTAMNGVYLVYPLAESTIVSSTSFTNPQVVYVGGTEEFIDEREVAIPVGHNSRYPKNDNYKLANIPAPPGGAGDYIVHTDEYGESVYQQAVTSVIGDGTWTSATTSDGVVTVSHVGGLGSTGAAGPTGNTASSAIWGKSITVPYIAFDEHGHISTSVNRTVTFPSNPNTNTVSTLRGDYTYLKTGADVGVKQYSLIARDSEGYYQSFTSGSGTASSKAINRTTYFDISKIFYYGGSANVAANTNMSTATLYYAVANADLRYSLNIATSTLTARKPVYLIFDKTASTVGTNGTRCYKLAGTSTNDWFTQTLPTSADGNIYVEIGKGVRDYRNDLTIHQTYYEYTDWLRSYDSISALEDKVIASFAYNPFAPEYTCSIPYQTLIDDGYRWIRDGRLEAVLHSGNSESVCKNIKYDDTEDFDFVDFYFTDKILHYTSSGISAIDIPSIPEILDITITDNNGTLSCNKTFADIKAWIDQDGHYVDDIQAKVTFVSTSVNDYSVDSINYYQDNSYWRIDFYFARGSIAYYDDNDILYIANGSVGDNAHAEGIATIASGKTSHAEGSLTKATSTAAHAEGYLTTADGKYSHAEGSETIADSESAHAEGWYSKATSTAAHAEGYKTTASGKYAHAEGQLTKAEGFCAHTEGWYTYALGSYCHSEGDKTTASDSSTHAEGNLTIASTACSHAEGYKTTAAGAYSHTEGASTKATAISAHAEGNSTTASGKSSHAGGTFTIANADYQTAIGQYNATVADALFIVGNGTATNARSNAMYVTTAGEIYTSWLNGSVRSTPLSDGKFNRLVMPSYTTGSQLYPLQVEYGRTLSDSGIGTFGVLTNYNTYAVDLNIALTQQSSPYVFTATISYPTTMYSAPSFIFLIPRDKNTGVNSRVCYNNGYGIDRQPTNFAASAWADGKTSGVHQLNASAGSAGTAYVTAIMGWR